MNKPIKVAETTQDPLKKLVYEVFELNAVGKELLKKMHEAYVDGPVFPCNPIQLQQFGSADIYAGFRSGQANVIKWIELQIQMCKDGN